SRGHSTRRRDHLCAFPGSRRHRRVGEAKAITEVLSWMPTPVPIPDELTSTLPRGLVGGGVAFGSQRFRQVAYFVSFTKSWKALGADAQKAALADPWKFKEFAWTVPIEGGYAMRNALLHLVYPDVFEDMIARDHKE